MTKHELGAAVLSEALTAGLRPFVDQGLYVGFGAAVWQDDELLYRHFFGLRDREAGTAFGDDTIVRIYSMSKPITGAAMAALWDQGGWQIDDPVAKYLPEFENTRVYAGGGPDDYRTTPQASPMTLRHLFTHTAGLSYGFEDNTVDELYRRSKLGRYYEGRWNPNLEELVTVLAQQPLMFQPGTDYCYSFAIDVLGRVAEVISGRPFRQLLQETLFGPLGMLDTDFVVDTTRRDRFAACYTPDEQGGLLRIEGDSENRYLPGHRLYSGGGGLVSTMHDYGRFLRMLLGQGELDGVRVQSPNAVGYMMTDHLPKGLHPYEEDSPGVGYGLCGSVRVEADPLRAWEPVGVYGWGGAASTSMWVDPANAIAGLILPQRYPADFAGADAFRRLVYTA